MGAFIRYIKSAEQLIQHWPQWQKDILNQDLKRIQKRKMARNSILEKKP